MQTANGEGIGSLRQSNRHIVHIHNRVAREEHRVGASVVELVLARDREVATIQNEPGRVHSHLLRIVEGIPNNHSTICALLHILRKGENDRELDLLHGRTVFRGKGNNCHLGNYR